MAYRPQGQATSTLFTVKLALEAAKLDEDWPCPSLTMLVKNRKESAASSAIPPGKTSLVKTKKFRIRTVSTVKDISPTVQSKPANGWSTTKTRVKIGGKQCPAPQTHSLLQFFVSLMISC